MAQFGRSIMADVSAALMERFVDNLEATVLGPTIADEGADTSVVAPTSADRATTSGARRIDSPEATPIDMVSAAGGTPLGRAAPLAAVVTLLPVVLVLRHLRRRRVSTGTLST